MFKKHPGRKSGSGGIILLFRLILSLSMFAVLLLGAYSAYKHFSGYDPLKLDPQAVLTNLIKSKTPSEAIAVFSSLKLPEKFGQFSFKKDSEKSNEIPADKPQAQLSGNVAFKFLVFADSHSDNTNLRKTIVQAKQKYPDLKFIIGLGDYTEVGTIEELEKAKSELDLSGLRYFLIPGDHDLWDSRDKGNVPNANFKKVFGPSYQSFTFQNFRFLLLYNSDNYSGIDDEQFSWITDDLEKAKSENSKVLAFLHTPIYHPSSDHVMGRVEKNLQMQAKNLLLTFKEAGVKRVFAGDIHYFSEYEEPTTNLTMNTIGAVTTARNPQAPRYAIVSIYENGEVGVEDVEIK